MHFLSDNCRALNSTQTPIVVPLWSRAPAAGVSIGETAGKEERVKTDARLGIRLCTRAAGAACETNGLRKIGEVVRREHDIRDFLSDIRSVAEQTPASQSSRAGVSLMPSPTASHFVPGGAKLPNQPCFPEHLPELINSSRARYSPHGSRVVASQHHNTCLIPGPWFPDHVYGVFFRRILNPESTDQFPAWAYEDALALV